MLLDLRASWRRHATDGQSSAEVWSQQNNSWYQAKIPVNGDVVATQGPHFIDAISKRGIIPWCKSSYWIPVEQAQVAGHSSTRCYAVNCKARVSHIKKALKTF